MEAWHGSGKCAAFSLGKRCIAGVPAHESEELRRHARLCLPLAAAALTHSRGWMRRLQRVWSVLIFFPLTMLLSVLIVKGKLSGGRLARPDPKGLTSPSVDACALYALRLSVCDMWSTSVCIVQHLRATPWSRSGLRAVAPMLPRRLVAAACRASVSAAGQRPATARSPLLEYQAYLLCDANGKVCVPLSLRCRSSCVCGSGGAGR